MAGRQPARRAEDDGWFWFVLKYSKVEGVYPALGSSSDHLTAHNWRSGDPFDRTATRGEGKIIFACAPTLSTIRFALRSVQTHISIRICFEMCVCTFFNVNPVGENEKHMPLEGKKTAFVK